MFSPGVWSWLPLPGLTPPVWSPGRFWLLGAGSRPASPLRSLAPSLSGVCAVRVTVSPPLVSSLTAARFGLWPYGLAIVALPLVSRPWTGLCWSHLLSLSSVGSVRGYTAPVGWLRGVFPCFANCPTSSVLKRSSFGISASGFASSLRDGVTLPGRVCSQSSIGTKALPPPSWCLVGVFAMGSPCRVGVVPDLDRNEDFLRTFPSGWCLAFAMGSPISGRVALFCPLDRNEGFFRSSILRCFAMGSPCGSDVFFRTLDRNEAYFG